jgi:hypothetical protein
MRQNRDYDGLPPNDIDCTKVQSELDLKIVDILHDLNRVTRGPVSDVPYNASMALYRLQLATARRDAQRISKDQRDRLLEALDEVAPKLHGLFPVKIMPADHVAAKWGLKAARGLIRSWHKTPEQRAAFPRNLAAITTAEVRILRNLLHNRSLAREVEELSGVGLFDDTFDDLIQEVQAQGRQSRIAQELMEKAAAREAA